ncbi:MAG: sulfatase-like hydrolase/transferase [Candidatus Aminicenantes bacterium]|nr:sulfatase-like hydrolase/transferase [Candidatus Aminicenantes bacterium]
MKGHITHICFFLVLLLFNIVFSPLNISSNGKVPKENVLLITIDTLRSDRLSCYGNQDLKTVNIDMLAERGVLFSRAFANTSTTLPSHTNIFLGATPNFHGVHENLNFLVSQELLTLTEYLKKNGYATGAFVGAYPLDSRFGLSQGFDIYDDLYDRDHSANLSSLERPAGTVVEAALDWLKAQKYPWFLWIHLWDPHNPYDPPEPFKTQYKERLYDGEIAYVDMILGTLFDYMQDNKLFDSTLIVFTGDHGESLGQHGEETHGYFAYNSTIWIPLIIYLPETTPKRIDDYVSHIDIFPTVCEVLGIRLPAFIQGTSLLPALKGKKLPEREIYFESLYPYYSRGWAPLKGFISKQKKFIDSTIPEFYDLDRDFNELNNLIDRENSEKLKSQLKKIIENLTSEERFDASGKIDRAAREKLASLGYISNIRVSPKKNFGARDDIKILLPFINKSNAAWKLYQQGKNEEGIKLLKEIINERKDIDLAYKNLASIYQEAGNIDEAVDILEQGIEALPTNYEIFVEYMKVLITAGQYDKVISSFEKSSMREAEYDPVIWNHLGTAYAKKENFEEAIKAFEVGLSLDEKYPELYHNLANAHYSYGFKLKDAYIFSKCFDFYKKAIELDPEYAEPYYGLGHAYFQEGNLEGAIFCWEKALVIEPNFSQAHFDLALLYLNSGNKTKAFELFSDYKKQYYQLLSSEQKMQLEVLLEKSRKK